MRAIAGASTGSGSASSRYFDFFPLFLAVSACLAWTAAHRRRAASAIRLRPSALNRRFLWCETPEGVFVVPDGGVSISRRAEMARSIAAF